MHELKIYILYIYMTSLDAHVRTAVGVRSAVGAWSRETLTEQVTSPILPMAS